MFKFDLFWNYLCNIWTLWGSRAPYASVYFSASSKNTLEAGLLLLGQKSLTMFIVFITGFRGGGRAMSADFWVSTEKPNKPFVFFLSRVNWSHSPTHEEQLSCPASQCAHSSAAVSSLLGHQMAVSILTIATSSFLPPLHCSNYFPTCCPLLSCGPLLHFLVLYGAEGPWQIWNRPPAFLRLLLAKGKGCGIRLSGGGDSRLADLHLMNVLLFVLLTNRRCFSHKISDLLLYKSKKIRNRK